MIQRPFDFKDYNTKEYQVQGEPNDNVKFETQY